MTTEDELVTLFAVCRVNRGYSAGLTVQAVHPPIQVDIATNLESRQTKSARQRGELEHNYTLLQNAFHRQLKRDQECCEASLRPNH